MTYQFYKDNIGKLTKEVRAKFKYFGMQLQLEERQAEERQAGIKALKTRADILGNDLAGLLYDKLQKEKEACHIKDLAIRALKEQVKNYQDKEPWITNGSE